MPLAMQRQSDSAESAGDSKFSPLMNVTDDAATGSDHPEGTEDCRGPPEVVDKVNVPVVLQRQAPMIELVPETFEVPQDCDTRKSHMSV